MPSIRVIIRVMLCILIITSASPIPINLYAQSVGNCDTNPRVALEDLNLDLLLELSMIDNSQARFKVSFLDTGTDSPHRHIDYLFTIEDQDGREIFNAAPPGQPTLHTAEGVVTIPYTFQKYGDYAVNIFVYGVDFMPTLPHITRFPCNDIPEFPIGMFLAVAAIMSMVMLIPRLQKLSA